MLENKPSTYKRASTLLTIFFASFFSIIATAQPTDTADVNAQNITTQLNTINQKILNKNNGYEELTLVLHNINVLQRQVTSCIKEGQTRLDKINHLLNQIKLSNTTISDTASYNYILREKTNKLTQIKTCEFLNYRLEEIQDIATDKINRVNKFKLLKRIPMWDKINFNLFSNINLNLESVYQHSGIGELNKMHWLALALIGLLGSTFALVLRKTNTSQTNSANNLSKDYIPYILPFGLVCACLNVMFPYTNPAPAIILIINALSLYSVILFLTRLYFMTGMKREPSFSTLHFFQFFIALITNFYVLVLQFLFFENASIPLKYVNFIYVTYIILVLKLLVTYMTGLKQWLTEKMVVTIQTRVFIVATVSLVAYTLYIIAGTLSLSSDFFTLLDTLYITLLDLAYFWLIAVFLNHWVATNYRKKAEHILKIICLSSIIAAWCGYHYLAIALIPNLILTAVVIILILDVNEFFKRTYFRLSDPNQVWSQKLRYFMGLHADDKLTELYVMRLVFTTPAIIWGIFTMMEIWGITPYQILNMLSKVHDGVAIFGATIRPTLVLRAATVFCMIVLTGRTLATYIIRKKMMHEEKHTQIMFLALVQYLSFTVGILMALYIAGFNLKNLVVVAGALSVGLGFGLQSFAKDFISGLVIMINKPIKIGDHIEVGERNINEGFIRRIGALSTQLHTLTHSDVIIPNSEIVTKVITNFTFSNNALSRINIAVNLDKNSDFELAKQLLLDIAIKNPNVVQEPPYEPVVLFELYELNLWCVINDVNRKEIIISDLNLEIAYAFKDMLLTSDSDDDAT